MNRIEVSSTNLRSIGHDPASQLLEVEFKNGRIYQFQNVPASVYSEFIQAHSHGAYFTRHIKDKYITHQVA